ncbi:MAG: hypothetical protein GX284_00320 [Clostridiales bacterium]|nr:hypothetical protein [Clostridiales bacterium]
MCYLLTITLSPQDAGSKPILNLKLILLFHFYILNFI